MKKSVLFMAVAFGFSTAVAQDLTSKKGEQMLPEAGDWSIGVDATPFLEYAGNFFGKSTTNNAPTFNFMNSSGRVIVGKYFVDATTAYRGGLRIGFGSETERRMVDDRSNNVGAPNNFPTADATVENTWKHSETNIGISAGIEKRRGKTRLQGYYGGELGLFIGSSKDAFTYGNALQPTTTTNTLLVDVHTTEDLFSAAGNIMNSVPSTGAGTGRVIERNNGGTFSFGLRGFIGVEYFILPKISLGGEFGWGLGISSRGATSSSVESIGNNNATPAGDDVVGTTTVDGAKQGSFSLDTDNNNSFFGASGTLRLNFHF
jgi:hypothetical protein